MDLNVTSPSPDEEDMDEIIDLTDIIEKGNTESVSAAPASMGGDEPIDMSGAMSGGLPSDLSSGSSYDPKFGGDGGDLDAFMEEFTQNPDIINQKSENAPEVSNAEADIDALLAQMDSEDGFSSPPAAPSAPAAPATSADPLDDIEALLAETAPAAPAAPAAPVDPLDDIDALFAETAPAAPSAPAEPATPADPLDDIDALFTETAPAAPVAPTNNDNEASDFDMPDLSDVDALLESMDMPPQPQSSESHAPDDLPNEESAEAMDALLSSLLDGESASASAVSEVAENDAVGEEAEALLDDIDALLDEHNTSADPTLMPEPIAEPMAEEVQDLISEPVNMPDVADIDDLFGEDFFGDSGLDAAKVAEDILPGTPKPANPMASVDAAMIDAANAVAEIWQESPLEEQAQAEAPLNEQAEPEEDISQEQDMQEHDMDAILEDALVEKENETKASESLDAVEEQVEQGMEDLENLAEVSVSAPVDMSELMEEAVPDSEILDAAVALENLDLPEEQEASEEIIEQNMTETSAVFAASAVAAAHSLHEQENLLAEQQEKIAAQEEIIQNLEKRVQELEEQSSLNESMSAEIVERIATLEQKMAQKDAVSAEDFEAMAAKAAAKILREEIAAIVAVMDPE